MDINFKVSNLAFAETDSDVENILSALNKGKLKLVDVSWIALEIDADITLRQKGINPILPVDLISVEDRKKIFLDAVEWSKHWLDGLELPNEKIIFKQNFTLADLVKDNIYLYFNNIFYLIYVIEAAISKLQVEKLIFPKTNSFDIRGIDHANEYYLAKIGKLISQKYGISAIEIEHLGDYRKTKKTKTKIDMIEHLIPYILGINPQRINFPELNEEVRKKIERKRILILAYDLRNPFWRLRPLCELLKEKTNCLLSPFCLLRQEEELKKEEIRRSDRYRELEDLIQPLLKKDKLLKNIIYQGIDLSDLCNQKLYWILNKYLPDYWLNYLFMGEKLKEMKFDLLIGSAHTARDPSLLATLHSFENVDIPTLLIPHGAQYCRYPETDKIKEAINLIFPAHYSHTAVIGDYVKEKLTSADQRQTAVRCTGSLEYETKKAGTLSKKLFLQLLGFSPRKKTIVYLLGRCTREHRMDYIGTAFDELKQSINDVIEVSNRLDCQLIIKPHPAFTSAKTWSNLWAKKGNYRILSSARLNSLILSIVDIAITSKSTMAITAIDRGIPTIIFEHQPREILFFEELAMPLDKFTEEDKKPFIRATGFDELFETCKSLLYEKKLSALLKNKYKNLGSRISYNHDGLQVKRITEFMAEIIDVNLMAII